MSLLLLVLGALVAWRLNARLKAMARAIAALTERLDHLQYGGRASGEPAAEPTAIPAREPESLPNIRDVPLAAREGVAAEPPRVPRERASEWLSLERWIGAEGLLYIGVAALIVGAAYFEKLAIDNEWIGETARIVQGAIAGVVLVYAGLRFVRSGYRGYGQVLCGCGLAVLYVTTYAAFNFYYLITRPAAFACMVAITLAAAVLADRHVSQGLAVFAVGGGFVSPFLLPSTADAQISLFGYDAILLAGTASLARRRAWPLLNVISYVLTLFTVAGWADQFYTPAKYLRTELFITLYAAIFLYMLWQSRRAPRSDAAQISILVLSSAPIAYYLGSLVILADHSTALLVWLLLLMVVGALAGTKYGPAAGFVTWLAVAAPLLLWISANAGERWLAPGLVTVGTVYLLALAAALQDVSSGRPLSLLDIVWLHGNGLVMFTGAYLLVEAVRVSAAGALAGTLGLWQWALAAIFVRRSRDLAVHFVALGFTLITIAIALQFDGPAVIVGWAAEGAVLLALGVREGRGWLRAGGAVLLSIAIGRSAALVLSPAPLAQAVLLNRRTACAAFVLGAAYIAASLFGRTGGRERRWGRAGTLVAGQFLTVAAITGEINAFWMGRGDEFARQMMLSVSWAASGAVLILVGLRRQYPPIRYFAIALLAVTILKVFFVDLAQLERVYRVLSVIGLGIILLVTSYLYQRAQRDRGQSPEVL
jgi:uncharacterized membrane protein